MTITHLRCAGVLAAALLSAPIRHHVHGAVPASPSTDGAAGQQEVFGHATWRRTGGDCAAGKYSLPAGSYLNISGAVCSTKINRIYIDRNIPVDDYPSYRDATGVFTLHHKWFFDDFAPPEWVLSPGAGGAVYGLLGYCPVFFRANGIPCTLAKVISWSELCALGPVFTQNPNIKVQFSEAGASGSLLRLALGKFFALARSSRVLMAEL